MATSIGETPDSSDTRQQHRPDGLASSGEGAASALARLKTQHEHRARQRPADEPGEARKQP